MMNDTYEQKRIKSLEAMLDTEREAARAEHQSGLNLVKYCGDESAWSLPMRGNDIVVRDCIQSLRQRLAEAEAVIDKLPKTADGVPVVPGMEVWCRFRDGKQIVGGTAYRSFTGRLTVDYHDQINLGDNDDDPIWAAQSDPSLACIYSTRAAAIAAKEETGK